MASARRRKQQLEHANYTDEDEEIDHHQFQTLLQGSQLFTLGAVMQVNSQFKEEAVLVVGQEGRGFTIGDNMSDRLSLTVTAPLEAEFLVAGVGQEQRQSPLWPAGSFLSQFAETFDDDGVVPLADSNEAVLSSALDRAEEPNTTTAPDSGGNEQGETKGTRDTASQPATGVPEQPTPTDTHAIPSQPSPQPQSQSQPEPQTQTPQPQPSPSSPSSSSSATPPPDSTVASSPSPAVTSVEPPCGGCGATIVGKYVTALEQTWHVECFCCGLCGDVVKGQYGTVREGGDERAKPTCVACHGRRKAKKIPNLSLKTCQVCEKPMEGTAWLKLTSGDYAHKSCFKRTCTSCGNEIDTPRYMKVGDKEYHPDCAKKLGLASEQKLPCPRCQQPLTGKCVGVKGVGYHKGCFVCSVCTGGLSDGFFEREGEIRCVTCDKDR